MKSPSPRMTSLLKRAGAYDFATASLAQSQLAKALTLPLRKGVLKGDIVSDIYQPVKLEPGQAPEFPLDLLAPGTESRHVAYTIPSTGRIPERHVEGDYLMVSTYDIGSSIDFALKYAEQARWDVVGRALEVLEGSFVRKMNTDGWRVLLAAGVGRNLVVYDDAATAGFFTKRLIALLKTVMRRNAGGNSTSVNRGRLTDLYMSPESLEDIRSWTLTEVDDVTRREIFLNDEYGLSKIFGVVLHDLDELGVGQEFQNYYTDTLGGTFAGSKTELCVGLDMDRGRQDSFVMPVRKEIELYEDPMFHRQRRAGFYGWGEMGYGICDARRVLLGSI